jgi:hypothetical protein
MDVQVAEEVFEDYSSRLLAILVFVSLFSLLCCSATVPLVTIRFKEEKEENRQRNQGQFR